MQEAVKETSPAATELDMAFHQEIGYLSGNVLLIQAMACVAYLLKHSIKANRQELLTDAGDKALFQQHQAIYEAIAAHDSQQAMTLMNEHLNFKKKKEKLAI
ncbi:hypothetical protein SDC9_100691 [bioreactor metagenome]|uniref:GntR C-terminal domain-containing protein n=1 Tax=bioreactor metagenome TaxID=1076179 RepID=A0A645ANQ0_9ZZZZ